MLSEAGNFIILSKALSAPPAASVNDSSPAKPSLTPGDGEISAASTPERPAAASVQVRGVIGFRFILIELYDNEFACVGAWRISNEMGWIMTTSARVQEGTQGAKGQADPATAPATAGAPLPAFDPTFGQVVRSPSPGRRPQCWQTDCSAPTDPQARGHRLRLLAPPPARRRRRSCGSSSPAASSRRAWTTAPRWRATALACSPSRAT